MKQSILLTRIDGPSHSKDLGVFIDGDNLTAHEKVMEFLNELPPETRYLGWNNEVYPQYKLKKVVLH